MGKKEDKIKANLQKIINPAEKFISQPEEERQIINGQEITQMKLATDQPGQAKDAARATERQTKKRRTESRKTAHTSVLITAEQKSTLEKLAIVKRVSVNELIGRFIDEGIKRSKEDLKKWDQIKEVLGYDN